VSPFRRLLILSAGVTLTVTTCQNGGSADQPTTGPDGLSDNPVSQIDDPDKRVEFDVANLQQWRRDRAEKTLHVNEMPSNADERAMYS